jgi:hypothetical protein
MLRAVSTTAVFAVTVSLAYRAADTFAMESVALTLQVL